MIGRDQQLFVPDILVYEDALRKIIQASLFLIIGASGTIGQAVTKEIFKRDPRKIHIIDISENNVVELVRDLRSTFGYSPSITLWASGQSHFFFYDEVDG
jgi:FlaA1/EpsC-like NDP-sugar epimerase